MGSAGKSRLRSFERNVELELEPLGRRDTIGLTVIFASLCVISCGGVLFFGGVWGHAPNKIGYTGLALILAGTAVFALTIRLLEPHKAVKHASHRLRHHARKLRPRREQAAPTMTDAQVDAIEDALDRQS